MAGICFYFENADQDVWSGKDFDAWNYACKVAGDIDKAIIINKSSQTLSAPGDSFDLSMDISFVSTLAAAEAIATGNIIYMVCPWAGGTHQELTAAVHQTADWYFFGAGAGWNPPKDGYYLPQAGTVAVHSVHACTAVMFDRYKALN